MAAFRRISVWLVVLALAPPSSARAQPTEASDEGDREEVDDDDLVLDDLVFEGESEADAVATSSDSVRVVELEEARHETADLGTILSRVEGVAVRRGGGLGSAALICI